jgi:hypothetical protein
VTDLEGRLQRALKADDPAPRDPMFRIEILARRERAAFRRRLWTAGAMALGAAILAPLGLGLIDELAGEGAGRLVALTAASAGLVAFLAAPWLGSFSATGGLTGRWRMRALAILRMAPGARLWP